MRTIESTGKTVDEAIYNGLVELGLSIDEVDIEILSGTKGIFGLGSKAAVRLTEKEHGSLLEQLFADEKDEPAQSSPAPKKKESQGPPIKAASAARAATTTPPARHSDRGRRHTQPVRPERERLFADRLPDNAEPFKAPGTLMEDSSDADFLYEVLRRMGMPETKIDPYMSEDGTVTLVLYGPGMGMLIGRRGETLNALQYLVSIYANKGDGEYRRVVVDTENYRAKRELALRKLARKKASEVRRSGKAISMEPMNSQERRILHAEIQNVRGITTASQGEDPNRYVVIKPSEE